MTHEFIKKSTTLLIYFFCPLALFSQVSQTFQGNISWEEIQIESPYYEDVQHNLLSFEGAVHEAAYGYVPILSKSFPTRVAGDVSVKLISYKTVPHQGSQTFDDLEVLTKPKISGRVIQSRNKNFLQIDLLPILKTSAGDFLLITEYNISYSIEPVLQQEGAPSFKTSSILNNGEVHKIAVGQSGMFQLTQSDLSNIFGSGLSSMNPRQVKLFTGNLSVVPELVNDPRVDDLEEVAIEFIGEQDGSIDGNDAILFYAQGPDYWELNDAQGSYDHVQNIYSNVNYYYLIYSPGIGKRVNTVNATGSAVYTTNKGNARMHYEKDLLNLLDFDVNHHPGGKDWFGETFKNVTQQKFTAFNIPNRDASSPVKLTAAFAARAIGTIASQFNVSVNGNSVMSVPINGVSGNFENEHAFLDKRTATFSPSGDQLDIDLFYLKPNSDAEGWLDYLTVNAKQILQISSSQFAFRDVESSSHPSTKYQIQNFNGEQVWNISDPFNPSILQGEVNGASATFTLSTNGIHELIAFGSNRLTPSYVGRVESQNLHAIQSADMLIVYHPTFKSAAELLAAHRKSHSGLNVVLADVNAIYNEFSSGRKDISGIRDFCRMIYERDPSFKYLLLFGDASFDYKNIKNSAQEKDFVPTFQTKTSNHPIASFPSDDFYGLLDPGEGNVYSGALDLGIGRLPVNTSTEANQVVQKIIHYDTSPELFGNWKTQMTFLADDEDSNIHVNDADVIASSFANSNRNFNLDKLYFDAFQQVSAAGGNFYPSVRDAINRMMFKGEMVVNYLGHGGSNGWAQERVLREEDYKGWSNKNKLPLFVTATCSFAPFDDSDLRSAGEDIFLNPNGGGIGLFTTTRAVYTFANKVLTQSVFDHLYTPIDGKRGILGDILREAKNTSGAGIDNSRKFTLLGDPSLALAYPELDIHTTKLNGQPIALTDTLNALEKVTIEGEVRNASGILQSDFNGVVFPTVYDKSKKYQTLRNDPKSLDKVFDLQKNILFTGFVEVVNGKFEFTFVVPKDIDYAFGPGKISYYGHNHVDREAWGFFDGPIIGGSNPSGITDNEGPEMDLFMNDEDFVFGGLTNENPLLLVKLFDDLGINTTGSGVGHDIVAVLDENTNEPLILNDFYEAEINDYTKGSVRYPLSKLSEGKHTLRVKAWDVSNNSTEEMTEFIVASSGEAALSHVLNYPNPFTTQTQFQFEHNLAGESLNVLIQIFTVSGRLVKTISETVQTEGFRITGLNWDGSDDWGGRIGKGVYLYKVQIQGENNAQTAESNYEKLVLLK